MSLGSLAVGALPAAGAKAAAGILNNNQSVDDARARTEAWLEGVYRDELGRELGAEGRQYWTDDVHERGQTREQVVANIRRSPEYAGYHRGLGERTPVEQEPVGPVEELNKVKTDWRQKADPTRTPTPQVGGRGMQNYMPIQMDRWMNVGVNPGRRLGVDLTPMEQLGSIPFITAGQYDQSLNRVTPTVSGGRFYGFLKNEPGSASSLASDLIDDMKKTI